MAKENELKIGDKVAVISKIGDITSESTGIVIPAPTKIPESRDSLFFWKDGVLLPVVIPEKPYTPNYLFSLQHEDGSIQPIYSDELDTWTYIGHKEDDIREKVFKLK